MRTPSPSGVKHRPSQMIGRPGAGTRTLYQLRESPQKPWNRESCQAVSVPYSQGNGRRKTRYRLKLFHCSYEKGYEGVGGTALP